MNMARSVFEVPINLRYKNYKTTADLGFNFMRCTKWNLGFRKHSEPHEGVLGAAPEANAFRAVYSLKLA